MRLRTPNEKVTLLGLFLLCAVLLLGTLSIVHAETYTYAFGWGSDGAGDGQFKNPVGMAFDSSGNIYVAEQLNHRVQKFTSSGTFILKWGVSGSGNGQFNTPTDVAVDSSGNVYVTDMNNHRVQKFSSTGTYLGKFGSSGTGDGQFKYPSGIAIDSSGNIYVADYQNDRIQKFDSTGTFMTKWGTSGSGNGQFNRPFGIVVVSSGNVYVTEYSGNRVQKFSSSGAFLLKWGTSGSGNGQFNTPVGIDVDSSGNVYVADQYNHRIQKFSSSGGFLLKWSPGRNPALALVDSSGNVYVSVCGTSRIEKFNLVYKVSFAAAPVGGGTTTPSGSNVLANPGTLQISASPNSGYVFDHWSSSTGSITFLNPTSASTSAMISGDGTITANFVLKKATSLTVNCVPPTVDKSGSMQSTVQGVLSADSSDMAGKQIVLSYHDGSSWQSIGTATTQDGGSYSLPWTVPSRLPNGFYIVEAYFAGDSHYHPCIKQTTNAADGGGMLVVPEYALGALGSIVACIGALMIVKRKFKIVI